jgi:hypothetical protein
MHKGAIEMNASTWERIADKLDTIDRLRGGNSFPVSGDPQYLDDVEAISGECPNIAFVKRVSREVLYVYHWTGVYYSAVVEEMLQALAARFPERYDTPNLSLFGEVFNDPNAS